MHGFLLCYTPVQYVFLTFILSNFTARLHLLLLWHTGLVLDDKMLQPLSDDLSGFCTSMSFQGDNLLESCFAPTVTGWTGVNIVSVFSSIMLAILGLVVSLL